jgi:ABC-type nitrate/sulfonate/bicarbonate transport system substrate-binding protein
MMLPTAASAADKVPVKAGIDVGVNSLPFWIGTEKGIFSRHGLDLTEKIYDSGFLGLLAIGANEGDISSQSDTPTLTLTGKGIDAVVVAVMARSSDNYKIVGKKTIGSPQELKGKKFGMTLGSACEYVGLKYLKANGIARTDLQIVGADPSELAPLLVRGEIDAACFWEPWGRKSIGLAPTTLHVIGTGRDIYAVNMYLTVRRKFADEHPAAVDNLLSALNEANAYIASHPQEAADMIQKKHRVSPELARAMSKDFEYTLTLDDQAVKTMKDVGQWLIDNKKLQRMPDLKRLIDPQYLKRAVPNAVTLKFD